MLQLEVHIHQKADHCSHWNLSSLVFYSNRQFVQRAATGLKKKKATQGRVLMIININNGKEFTLHIVCSCTDHCLVSIWLNLHCHLTPSSQVKCVGITTDSRNQTYPEGIAQFLMQLSKWPLMTRKKLNNSHTISGGTALGCVV